MIWVTWRQHHLQLEVGAAMLLVLGAVLLATGPGILAAFRTSGLAACLASSARSCDAFSSPFLDRYSGLQVLVGVFLLLPAMAGLFWGAPLLAREYEQGTYRLAWTQGVTRRRWLLTKLAVLVGLTALAAAAASWALSWWSRPLVAAGDNRFNPGIFDIRGIVPVGYALFALALGVAFGAVIRRTVAAMGASLASFAIVRVVTEVWLRRRYLPPRTLTTALTFGPGPRLGMGDWEISTRSVDAAGRFLGSGRGIDLGLVGKLCPEVLPRGESLPDKGVVSSCLHRIGAKVIEVYQPGGRYWAFQGIETAIFVLLATGLLGFGLWWVGRRVS
jgi:hypothetical protein